MANWIRVTRASVCPVCEHPDFCMRSPDGEMALCMRVESNKPARCKLGGWIHRLNTAAVVPVHRPRMQPRHHVYVDWQIVAREMFKTREAAAAREGLVKSLGVSAEALTSPRRLTVRRPSKSSRHARE